MNHRLHAALLAVLGGSGVLGGCSTRTDVSLTGNTPPQYSHVWVTVQEVWFNGSATAGPDDSGWTKHPLSKPSTVDLVAQNGGNLGNIASSLRVPASTYSQVRLIPVDATAPLADSAKNAGALYNFEADYVDSSGNTQQLQLELLNPDRGIGIQTSLRVPFGTSGSGLIPVGTNTSTTNTTFGTPTGTAANPFGTTTGTTNTTTPSISTTSTTGNTNTTPTNSFAVAIDGSSDLVPFTYTGSGPSGTLTLPGILLSSHGTAYDLSQAGAISGTLTLTNITTAASGLPAISVTAQTLSADGSRHVIVSASSVLADGSFLLYPLSTNSSTNIPLTYDVVIAGPGIATIIIKNVQVPRPSNSSTSTTQSTTTLTTPTNSFTGTSTSTTTSSGSTNSTSSSSLATSNTNVSAVSIGTLTPRAATAKPPTSFDANIATASGAALPAGAVVNFYQTLGRSGEVPYVIDSSPIDPFNQVLFNDQALSLGTVDSGTWSTNGTVTLVGAAPKEKAGTYLVAASAPGFSDGALGPNPPTVSDKNPTVVLPALQLAQGASAGSVIARVVPAVANKYDQGELLLSHNGTLVAAMSISTVISQGTGGTVTMQNVPSGTPDAVYYATVRAWCSGKTGCSNPPDASGVQRQWYPQVIDLRTSTTATIDLPVN